MPRHRQRLLGALLALLWPGLALGQMAGSPTPGNRSTLAYGAVTTAAPTYATGLNSALSLDTSGNLRVNSTAAVPAGTNTIGKVDVLGNAGATMDTTPGGSAATNALQVQGVASMTPLDGNVKNVGGNAVSTAASGTQKVGIVGNAGATVDATVGAGTAPTNMLVAGGVFNSTPPSLTTGQSASLQLDANGGVVRAPFCTKVINVAQTASTDVHTFTHFGYICAIVLVSATAQNIGIREGTGTTCATGPTSLVGDSSGTAEINLAANGGFSAVSSTPWLKLQASADHLCVEQSSTGEVAGTITYADLAN